MSVIGKISINPDVMYQKLDGEVVLLNTETEKYFGLNKVGAHFWELISHNSDFDETFKKMLDIFEVPEDRLRADLIALTHNMVDNKILKLEIS